MDSAGSVERACSTTIDPTFRINEDNGWPNVEGRIAMGLGRVEGTGLAAMCLFEVGFSGVVGQMCTTPPAPGARVVEDVWGLATDVRWRMNDRFGVMGEVYTGQTLGTYNGGILQNINTDTLDGIRSTGGRLEVFYYWTPCFHSHTGYGIDDPLDGDVASSGGVQQHALYQFSLGSVLRYSRRRVRIPPGAKPTTRLRSFQTTKELASKLRFSGPFDPKNGYC